METAWLIEHPDIPMWIGECSGKIYWTGNEGALRFSREEDAQAFNRALITIDPLNKINKITEHSWMDPE